ncbi:MAG TPA: efflux RND transporter permease subunit [Acidobacteriota bacterium]|nr:efflux RND transporter permease subunit [Acidobacteriota bacterium]
MDITRFAIERDRVTLTLLLLVFIAGAAAYLAMPRAMDPGFTIRTALVVTRFPGASPERVENLVTDKLEEAIQEMPELDAVRSQSKTGLSIVYVDILESYTEMRPIWDSLRRKVDGVRPDLPDEIIGPFVNDEFGDVFGIIVAITGEGVEYSQLKEVADSVRDELLRIDDTGKVDIVGAQEERLFVEYNEARLAELGLSTTFLRQTLEARNIIIPGGNVRTGHERIVLEPSGNFDSVEDLARTVINVPGRDSDQLVYLEDIADVRRGYVDPPSTKMNANGERSLGLAVSMREGGNLIALGEQVKALVDSLPAQFPIGIDFEVVAFEPARVDKKVRDFVGNVVQAVALVLLVMLVMLGLRTGLVVATLIPSAMVMSLLLMDTFSIGLDQMSLAALIIALGLLVDNAIVMAEAIMVRMGSGEKAVEAAVAAASELRVPLLTSSLTTSAAFLPIYLAESAVGEYTAPLFKVVTITLLSSWLLALTVIPLLCVKFLKVKEQQQDFKSRFYRLYRLFLKALLRFPPLTVIGVLVIFLLTLQLFALIPNIFFPESDVTMFTAELALPVGTAIEHNEEVVAEISRFVEEELRANPVGGEGGGGVVNWSAFIGQGAPRFYLSYSPEQTSPEYSFLLFNAASRPVINELIPKLEDFCRQRFPDLKTTIRALATGPIIRNPIEVRLSGPDAQRLFALADTVKARLAQMEGPKNIDDDWGQRTKKIVVDIDEARARRSGVSNQDVAVSLQTVLSGFQTTEYREGDEIIPVILRSSQADREDIGKLESLNVFSQASGQTVPLKQIADLDLTFEAAKIYRRDRLKTITISSGLERGFTATQVTDQLIPYLESESASWPIGYRWELGGEFENSGNASESINEKLPIAGLIIVLLLVGQFNSLRRAAIIVLTIPLGLIGVVLGLLIMKSYFGFMTLLGVVSLAGIVINNAIVLIDRIDIEIGEGLSPQRAVMEAAQQRLRPILLTTLTTVLGLIPLYLGGGPMFEPLAIAVMFGLVFATLLTLGVVPVLYALLFRVSFKGFRY